MNSDSEIIESPEPPITALPEPEKKRTTITVSPKIRAELAAESKPNETTERMIYRTLSELKSLRSQVAELTERNRTFQAEADKELQRTKGDFEKDRTNLQEKITRLEAEHSEAVLRMEKLQQEVLDLVEVPNIAKEVKDQEKRGFFAFIYYILFAWSSERQEFLSEIARQNAEISRLNGALEVLVNIRRGGSEVTTK